MSPTSRADRNAIPVATGQRRVPDTGQSDPEATPAPLTRKPAGRGANPRTKAGRELLDLAWGIETFRDVIEISREFLRDRIVAIEEEAIHSPAEASDARISPRPRTTPPQAG